MNFLQQFDKDFDNDFEFEFPHQGVCYDGRTCVCIRSELNSFFHSKIKELIEEMKKCVPEELINTKEESKSDWFYGYGFNSAREQVLKNLEKLK